MWTMAVRWFAWTRLMIRSNPPVICLTHVTHLCRCSVFSLHLYLLYKGVKILMSTNLLIFHCWPRYFFLSNVYIWMQSIIFTCVFIFLTDELASPHFLIFQPWKYKKHAQCATSILDPQKRTLTPLPLRFNIQLLEGFPRNYSGVPLFQWKKSLQSFLTFTSCVGNRWWW